MADKYLLCIIGEMDRLWFQQIILFSQQPITASSVAPHEPVEIPIPISESTSCSSSILSLPPLQDEETSTDESSPSPEKQVFSESIFVPIQDGSFNNKEETKEGFARIDLLDTRTTHSCSSSPSTTQKRHRKFRKPATSSSTRKLDKSMSCRTLGELELDEVKGFMDLGFMFKKEYISPRMISVLPGLQRPDSPLLNLKVPKHCSADNMKKHLKFWAKTVASEIQQE
uniref:Uncharacterized protein n=1 Tax=Lotus japonicus TaxID=34305 RepID=I3SMS1_LOTJA|nr:unknown [Lotus japonicus]